MGHIHTALLRPLWGPSHHWLLSVSKLLTLVSSCSQCTSTSQFGHKRICITFLGLIPIGISLSSIPLTKEGLKPAVLKGSSQVVGDAHGDSSYSLFNHQILFHTLFIVSPSAEEGAHSVRGRDRSSYETHSKWVHMGHGRNQE